MAKVREKKLTTSEIKDIGSKKFETAEDAFSALEDILRSVTTSYGDKHDKAKAAVESIISGHPAFSLAIYDLYFERNPNIPISPDDKTVEIKKMVDIPKLTINAFFWNNKELFTEDGRLAIRAINFWGLFWKPQEISLSEQDSYREAKKVDAAGTVLRDAEMTERDKHLLFVEDLTDAVTILTKRFNGLSARIKFNGTEDYDLRTIVGETQESHHSEARILPPVFQWKLDRQRPA